MPTDVQELIKLMQSAAESNTQLLKISELLISRVIEIEVRVELLQEVISTILDSLDHIIQGDESSTLQ